MEEQAMKRLLLLLAFLPSLAFAQGMAPSSSSLNLTSSTDSTVASGSRAFSLLQGAHLDFDGTGNAKYLSSDGTTLTATGLAFSASALTSTATSTNNGLVLTQGALICLNGSGCTIRMSYDGTNVKIGDNTNTYIACASATGLCTFNFGASIAATKAFAVGVTDNSASPGATTINNPSGKAAVAAAASSVVVTNNLLTTTDRVILTPLDIDSTCTGYKAVAGTGSFTVTMNANCTAAWKFQFLVLR
jgi:hypothetical protein